MTYSPAVALTQALIRCPSVTPLDAGALDVLERTLGAAGFACQRKIFQEAGTPDVDNFFARIGEGAPHLVFAGHTDVVPPGETARWRFNPFSGEIAEGRIFGRGASDMKGAIAAFAAAALEYLRRHGPPKGAISFLITGDEEGPSINGTVKLLDWARDRGERFDHCIVGEPTNVDALGDMMKIGRRGSLNGHVSARGKQGHVAYPERAHNPLPALARVAAALSAHQFDAGTAHFARTNLEITSIDVGNPTTNVIPAIGRASFNVRFNDIWTPETLQERVREVARAAAGDTLVEFEFAPCNARAFVTQPGPFTELVAHAAREVTGREPRLSTSGGTSDARFVVRDCPVVEFGLLNQTIHAIDENATLGDIDALTRVYFRILEGYFGAA
ncbi:MAG: succinyl-diaminopimelate desuccinylase [Methylocystis sp.]